MNTECGNTTNVASVLASIIGSSNISIQCHPSNKTVFNKIVFEGDNSNFTGTLQLHPSITDVVFKTEKSVISNLSIPEVIPNPQYVVPSTEKVNTNKICVRKPICNKKPLPINKPKKMLIKQQ